MSKEKQKYQQELQEKLKSMTLREKLSYFWYYYKVHTIVITLLLILGGILIRDKITQKDIALNVMMVNARAEFDEEMVSQDFLPSVGLDPSEYTLYLDASPILNTETFDSGSMAYAQKISAMAFAGGLDILIGDEQTFQYYAPEGFFTDPEAILPAETFDTFRDHIFYTEMKEETGKTIKKPAAIRITDSPRLQEWNVAASGEIYLGFISSSKNPETALAFLEYLYPGRDGG